MKKALLVTDGSVDQALSLSHWLETQSDPIDLTVVYGYTIAQPANQSLRAAVYREAKQEATESLNHWLSFLPASATALLPNGYCFGQLHTELLLGDPELVRAIYLLLRRYDYLLIDVWQQGVRSTYKLCQRQISTQLQCISTSDRSSDPAEQIRELEQRVPTGSTNNRMPVTAIYHTVS